MKRLFNHCFVFLFIFLSLSTPCLTSTLPQQAVIGTAQPFTSLTDSGDYPSAYWAGAEPLRLSHNNATSWLEVTNQNQQFAWVMQRYVGQVLLVPTPPNNICYPVDTYLKNAVI
jgi:hypothetical protein